LVVIARPRGEDGPEHVIARFVAHLFAPEAPRSVSHSDWFISGDLVRTPGGDQRLAVDELRIESAIGTSLGITSTVLRSISISAIKAQVVALLLDTEDYAARADDLELPPLSDDHRESVARAAEAVRGRKLKRGRQGYSRDFYRWVTNEYMEFVATNGQKGVHPHLARVAAKSLRRKVSPNTARAWVSRARELGILAEAEQRGAANPVRGRSYWI
jgi:hypothetical protein